MSQPGKREEILAAALELIAERGFHNAPMSLIAGQAGVGAGTIYRYFENKELLIAELFGELHIKVRASLLEGYDPEKTIETRFLHLGRGMLRYFIDNPLEFRYLEQYHNSPYGAAFRRDNALGKGADGDLFRRLFEEGLARQAVKNLPLTVLFALAFGPLFTVARDHIFGFIKLDEILITQTVKACWDGIRNI
ncbi:MAG: TetR/AcrR family transcriptional regulator [bacterium]|nr:TetR/AcrR family transcriptional regulator [bacterium]